MTCEIGTQNLLTRQYLGNYIQGKKMMIVLLENLSITLTISDCTIREFWLPPLLVIVLLKLFAFVPFLITKFSHH